MNDDKRQNIKCNNCGSLVPTGKFCVKCGNKIVLFSKDFCFGMCLFLFITSIICTNLFLIGLIFNLTLGIILFGIGIVSGLLSIIINVYGIIYYPNIKFFKYFLIFNIAGLFV